MRGDDNAPSHLEKYNLVADFGKCELAHYLCDLYGHFIAYGSTGHENNKTTNSGNAISLSCDVLYLYFIFLSSIHWGSWFISEQIFHVLILA